MTHASHADAPQLGGSVSLARMPAHWMLGRLGKKVMRPGGLQMSLRMVEALDIGPDDDVVDFWPGLGITTERMLARGPRSYVAVERGQAEAARVRAVMREADRCLVAPAHQTSLSDGCASVAYGEALLTLEHADRKTATVAEAHRLLRPGGRYGIHELLLTPEGLSEAAKDDIERTLTRSLHVLARPLTQREWSRLLEDGGFTIDHVETGGMLLLNVPTFVADEGWGGTFTFLGNSIVHPSVLPRIAEIWRVFRRYRDNLGAIAITAHRS